MTSPSASPAVQERFAQTDRLPRLTAPGRLDPEARDQFVGIEQIARLPTAADRAAQLPHLYRDLVTRSLMDVNTERGLHEVPGNPLANDRSSARDDFTAQYAALLNEAAQTMSPTAVAEKIAAAHSSAVLLIASRRRAIWIFNQDMPGLKSLIDADLASEQPDGLKRALSVIGGMKLTEYGPRVVEILLADGPASPWAELALDGAGGASLVVAAAEAKPELVKRYAYSLSNLLANQPPSPMLMKLLDSPDPEMRVAAATAVSKTNANSAIELAPKLMNDTDERVRMTGLDVAYRVPADVFGAVRNSVIPALKSSSIKERVRAAEVLSMKHDPACAKTLLEFTKDPQFPTEHRLTVSRAVHTLTGQRGALMYDTRNWGAGAGGRNGEMISQLEQWIASQP